MSTRPPALPGLIVGGTEKAGTTSVFDWLSTHPEVGASARKETDFFRHDWSGQLEADRRRYAACFERVGRDVHVLVEASPGYLGEAGRVAPRIGRLVPGAKLLFILRDPVERLYSSYHFHRAKLDLPVDLAIDDYVDRCLAYGDGRTCSAAELGLDEWYLEVLRRGRYAEHVEQFRRQLPAGQVKVMFFEHLCSDPQGFMSEVSRYAGIDERFWRRFAFRRSNVTFSARHAALHRLAMHVNAAAEPSLRRFPALKRSLVRVYKTFNQQREGYEPMPPATRARLVDYYAPSVQALQALIDVPLPESWSYASRCRASA